MRQAKASASLHAKARTGLTAPRPQFCRVIVSPYLVWMLVLAQVLVEGLWSMRRATSPRRGVVSEDKVEPTATFRRWESAPPPPLLLYERAP